MHIIYIHTLYIYTLYIYIYIDPFPKISNTLHPETQKLILDLLESQIREAKRRLSGGGTKSQIAIGAGRVLKLGA